MIIPALIIAQAQAINIQNVYSTPRQLLEIIIWFTMFLNHNSVIAYYVPIEDEEIKRGLCLPYDKTSASFPFC